MHQIKQLHHSKMQQVTNGKQAEMMEKERLRRLCTELEVRLITPDYVFC